MLVLETHTATQLTDALCASTCAVFLELMHHEAGVHTVVVGGRPEYGPMQAPGETRGAQFANVLGIDLDIRITESINTTTKGYLPDRLQDMVASASMNLRD